MDYMLLKSGEVMTFTTEHMAESIPALLQFHSGLGYYFKDKDGKWHSKLLGEPPNRGCGIIPDEDVPGIIKLAAMLE